MMKLFFTVLFFSFSLSCFALTGDTIHVKKYSLSLDSIDYTKQRIRGHATLVIEPKLNGVNNITLSLLKLTIDSITSGGQLLSFTYNDTTIRITPLSALNLGDTLVLTVYYGGKPQLDAKFGGFYFNGVYAFNIGVGFAADPHPIGRYWFPCIDEFTDKSVYDFHIVTDSAYKAFCNGNLDSVIYNGNGMATWHWTINELIPSYLAAVAVAPFTTLKYTYQGIPVEIACLPSDVPATVSAFAHLDSCLMFFMRMYGAYPWNKVGYVAVPFTGGAMEHATSIHIGKIFVSPAFETTWAHELSHMWWGDKVTCTTEQDMWLNEGTAVANEHLFTELFYGTQAYKTAIRSNLRQVLQFSHVVDGGYHALNAVPHAYTYGRTVYLKGASIVHTLRKYMGDSAFFQGARSYMNNLAYGNASSADFRDQLSSATGIPLTTFFNDWVFTAGFPHFAVDSFKTVANGSKFNVTVYTRQKQKGNTHIYTMPVECTFSNGVVDTTVTMLINAATNSFTYTLNFSPLRTTIDKDDKMADAIIADERILNATGNTPFAESVGNVNVKTVGAGPSVVRIEHNFVAPDDFKNIKGIRVSDYHYFRVDGVFQTGFLAAATFFYNGSLNPGGGYLDNTLITGKEDSLVLLYRTGTTDDWHIVTAATANYGGSRTDKIGNFTVDTLKKGEYAFGYKKYNVGINEADNAKSFLLQAYPNPTAEGCTIGFTLPPGKKGKIQIHNQLGQNVFSSPVFSHQQSIWWDTFKIPAGIYTAIISDENTTSESTHIVVIK